MTPIKKGHWWVVSAFIFVCVVAVATSCVWTHRDSASAPASVSSGTLTASELAERAWAAKALSRDKEREPVKPDRPFDDPLDSTVDFARAMQTYAPPTPTPVATPTPTQSVEEPESSVVVTADGLNWAALAECESGGDPTTNTGNGYYGMYQFSLSTWQSQGGTGLPSEASAAEQTMRAQILYRAAGDSPWPVCGPLLYS